MPARPKYNNEDSLAKTIGKNIKTAREAIGMPVVELAERIGVSSTAVSNWEHGKMMSMPALLAVSQILHVSMDDLAKRKTNWDKFKEVFGVSFRDDAFDLVLNERWWDKEYEERADG